MKGPIQKAARHTKFEIKEKCKERQKLEGTSNEPSFKEVIMKMAIGTGIYSRNEQTAWVEEANLTLGLGSDSSEIVDLDELFQVFGQETPVDGTFIGRSSIVDSIFRLPEWWQRRWVIQEVLYASQNHFVWGRRAIL